MRGDMDKYRLEVERLKPGFKSPARKLICRLKRNGTLFVVSFALLVAGLIIAGFMGHTWAMITAGALTLAAVVIIAVDRWINPREYHGVTFPCTSDEFGEYVYYYGIGDDDDNQD